MYQPSWLKYSYLGMFNPERIKIGGHEYLAAPNLLARKIKILRCYRFWFSNNLEEKRCYENNIKINGSNIAIKGMFHLVESSSTCALEFKIFRDKNLLVSGRYVLVSAKGFYDGFRGDSLPYIFRSGNRLLVLMVSKSHRRVLELAYYDICRFTFQHNYGGHPTPLSSRRYIWTAEVKEKGIQYKIDYCTHPWRSWKTVQLRHRREIDFNNRSRPSKGNYSYAEVLEKSENKSADEVIISSGDKELTTFVWDSQVEKLAEDLWDD